MDKIILKGARWWAGGGGRGVRHARHHLGLGRHRPYHGHHRRDAPREAGPELRRQGAGVPGAKGSSGWSPTSTCARIAGVAPKAMVFNIMTTKVALGAVVVAPRRHRPRPGPARRDRGRRLGQGRRRQRHRRGDEAGAQVGGETATTVECEVATRTSRGAEAAADIGRCRRACPGRVARVRIPCGCDGRPCPPGAPQFFPSRRICLRARSSEYAITRPCGGHTQITLACGLIGFCPAHV